VSHRGIFLDPLKPSNFFNLAAHCVVGRDPNTLKVRAGEWDTQTINELYHHSDNEVADVIVHESFYKGGLHNDVALLILKQPVPFAETVRSMTKAVRNQ
jgi:kallikrein